jgi:hypothetical protein
MIEDQEIYRAGYLNHCRIADVALALPQVVQ